MKDYSFSTGLFLSTVAIFAPVKALILITLILILVDLVTGVLAAKKRGETIKSAGLRRTVTKLLVYQTAIMLGFLVEKYMVGGFIPISNIAAGLISIVEFKSCLENLNTINGNPVFKSLIDKLGSTNDIKNAIEEVKKIEKKPEE